MRASAQRAGVWLLLSISPLFAASAVRADDLLVMPYACSMVGGRPLLTPAPEQSHPVIGAREQRTFTACSPANPGFCRTWTVHRFDMDCEGARVPWVEVVASMAEERTRRAWMEGGRLVVRMPPSWSLEPDDPCARPPSFDDRFGFGRMRRYCADRRAMAPPPIVAMPLGFAPMLDIDGIFVRPAVPDAGPPSASTVAPPGPRVAASPPGPAPKAAHSEPAPSPKREEVPSAPPHRLPADNADKVAVAKEAPAPGPPKIAAKPPTPAPVAAAKAPPTTATEQPATQPGAPIVPKIINRPDATNADAPNPNQPAAPASSLPSPPPQKSAAAPSASDAALPNRVATPPTDASGNSYIPVNLISAVRTPTAGIVAFGLLAAALLAAFAVARRRERLAAPPPARDIGSVSLDGRKARGGPLVPRPSAAPTAARPQRPPQPPAPAPGTPSQQPAHAWADRIPQTRAEALQMLGMGVSPDATEAAVKKIVDGLRLSWHPDLAKNEPDRRLREFRIKQINAAWDLIAGKRLERLDS